MADIVVNDHDVVVVDSAEVADGNVESGDSVETLSFRIQRTFNEETNTPTLTAKVVRLKKGKKRAGRRHRSKHKRNASHEGDKEEEQTGAHSPDREERSDDKSPQATEGKESKKKKRKNRKKKKPTTENVPTLLSQVEVTLDPNEVIEDRVPEDKLKDYNRLRQKVLNTLPDIDIKFVQEEETVESLLESELARSKENAFYLVNLSTIIHKYIQWVTLLPNVVPFYAYKCNPDFNIVRALVSCGAGLDCASKGEIESALRAGCKPSDIIFANPCKMSAHISFAKEVGVDLMTFDNKLEVEKVARLHPNGKLVLRILGDDSHSVMRFGSKFGARVPDEAADLLRYASSMGVKVVGVSFHVGSACSSPEAYRNTLLLARQVYDLFPGFGHKFELLDIGGGWPGVDTKDLHFHDLAVPVSKFISEIFPSDVRIIAEPGRYFATECTTLACSVIGKRNREVKENREADSSSSDSSMQSGNESGGEMVSIKKMVHYYISDGVYGSFNNLFFDHAEPQPTPLKKPVAGEDGVVKKERSTLFGPTCDSIDVICKDVEMAEMEIGDWVYFANMGAYTSAAASSFNGFRPPQATYIVS